MQNMTTSKYLQHVPLATEKHVHILDETCFSNRSKLNDTDRNCCRMC